MYAELRAHSAYSFGDGTCSPEQLVSRAADLGYGALGLTDTSDLGGVIRFTLEANAQGIKPVVGAELKVDGHPTAFLARNERGYRNLARLVTRARIGRVESWQLPGGEGAAATDAAAGTSHGGRNVLRSPEQPVLHHTSARPVVDRRGHDLVKRYATPLPDRGRPELSFEDVAECADGLWCLTGPASGEVATYVGSERAAEAMFMLERWRDVFADRLAIEVQLHHVSGRESALATSLIELAERQRLPWVVSNDPRYLDNGGRLVHDLLTANRADVCVNTAASWGLLLPNGEWRLKSPREMASLWKGREAGLRFSCDIAADCAAFDLRWLRPPLPSFDVPAGHDDDSFLAQCAWSGARERWGEPDERQRAQLEHELRVIRSLGFAGFFLVMWDAVRFARSRGILCQGRGSAANSAVAYCLGITAVDPVRHGLLFERFLSEVRTDGGTEAPDIDVDFEMHRREEVLDYMYDRYRRAHSAITAVTQLYHAPTALQDMMRALGYPADLAFTLSKRSHHWEPSQLAEELKGGMAKEYGLELDDPRGRALLSSLQSLDDVPRLRSTHPGGFVLSSDPLGAYLPIEHTSMGRTILQFDKDDLDAAGVPKFDFLGLGGLSAVHLAFDAIEKRTGEKMEMYRLPVDDAKTYEMISAGDTVGTFQIESRAQIQSILHTKPERLYDIVVQVALIRPGPIQARFVHPYTERRRGREEVSYAHPLLEPILRRTYGVPIFQEQAMAISMALGGYTASEADELRRTMGHHRKLPKLQAALEKLKRAIVARDIDESVAEQITNDLVSFANYGFPESHAWSFALIAYATAWLKANYPTEFYLGMLNAWPMGFYPPATLVHDAMRHGVIVRPPCLARGEWDCTIETDVFHHGEHRGHREQPAQSGTAFHHREHSDHRETAHNDSGRKSCSGDEANTNSVFDDRAKHASREEAPPRPFSAPSALSAVNAVDERAATTNGKARDEPSVSSVSSVVERQPVLRIGWRHIRGLGEKTRKALQQAHQDGPFESIADVVRRASLSRADALHLARAGAFEAFEPGRRRAAWEALRVAGDLLPLAPARVLPFEPRELEGAEMIFLDYLATGISTNGHPMQHLRARLRDAGVCSSAELDDVPDGGRVCVGGLVVARQHPSTAKGTVFVLLEDEFGFLNVIVSRDMYAANREVVRHAPFLLIEGRLEREDRAVSIVGRRFRELRVHRPQRESVNYRPQVEKVNYRSRDFH
ncbi:MAG: DNA polymerase III subunit alpha [Longimicrobiales bacterium]